MEDKELRKEIDEIFEGCYSRDLSACPLHTIFQRQKALNEILSLVLPLIEQEKKEAMRQRQSWLANVCGWRNPEQIQGLIKQEQRRIIAIGDEFVRGFRVDAHVFWRRVQESL